MQILPHYLLNNRVQVIITETGHITEYMPVYSRQLQIYKGIDNTVQFYILNADQKPVDVSDKTVRFTAYDSERRLCLDLPADPVKWDDSTVRTGMFQVTISRNDLIHIDPQYISYWIRVMDYSGIETLTYTGAQFDNPATARINDSIAPHPKPVSVAAFSATAYNHNRWYTDPVTLEPGVNSNSALHTAVIYTTGFIGPLYTEVSLEDNVIGPNEQWTQLGEPILFTGEETEPVVLNFHGVFNWVRFCTDTDPEDLIPRILVRT